MDKPFDQDEIEPVDDGGLPPEIYSLQALAQADLGRGKNALQSIQNALAIDEYSSQAHLIKSYIHTKMGNYKLAEQEADWVLKSNPSDRWANAFRAINLNLQNMSAEGDKKIFHFESSFKEGWYWLRQNDMRQATQIFKQILQQDSTYEPARIGMIEVIKAKSGGYKLYLNYLLILLRILQVKNALLRWIIFTAIAFIPEIILKIGHYFLGRSVPIFHQEALIFVYVFVFASWFASGFFNLNLLIDSSTRCVLHMEEKLEGIFIGGMVLSGIALLTWGCLINSNFWVWTAEGMLCAAIPLSHVFMNQNLGGRIYYGISALYLFVGCFVNGILMQNYGFRQETLMQYIVCIGFLVFIAALFAAANGILYEKEDAGFKIHRIDELTKDLLKRLSRN